MKFFIAVAAMFLFSSFANASDFNGVRSAIKNELLIQTLEELNSTDNSIVIARVIDGTNNCVSPYEGVGAQSCIVQFIAEHKNGIQLIGWVGYIVDANNTLTVKILESYVMED